MKKMVAKKLSKGLLRGDDAVVRCFWAGDDLEYQRYHDEEWGVPVTDDVRLYEKLCLEGFQSGLSWRTILHKRPAFRAAFADFDFNQVAKFNQKDVQRLLGDAGIVRHRGKIEAAIVNASEVVRLRAEGQTLASFVWAFQPAKKTRPKRLTLAALKKLTATDASTALSKALKKRGFRFVGPTTAYAFMQSMGIVNDHLEGCPRRAEVEVLRSKVGAVEKDSFGSLRRVSGVGANVDLAAKTISFSLPAKGPGDAVPHKLASTLRLTKAGATKLEILSRAAMVYQGSIDGHVTESQGQSLTLEFEHARRKFGARGHMLGPPGEVVAWLIATTGVPPFG